MSDIRSETTNIITNLNLADNVFVAYNTEDALAQVERLVFTDWGCAVGTWNVERDPNTPRGYSKERHTIELVLFCKSLTPSIDLEAKIQEFFDDFWQASYIEDSILTRVIDVSSNEKLNDKINYSVITLEVIKLRFVAGK